MTVGAFVRYANPWKFLLVVGETWVFTSVTSWDVDRCFASSCGVPGFSCIKIWLIRYFPPPSNTTVTTAFLQSLQHIIYLCFSGVHVYNQKTFTFHVAEATSQDLATLTRWPPFEASPSAGILATASRLANGWIGWCLLTRSTKLHDRTLSCCFPSLGRQIQCCKSYILH